LNMIGDADAHVRVTLTDAGGEVADCGQQKFFLGTLGLRLGNGHGGRRRLVVAKQMRVILVRNALKPRSPSHAKQQADDKNQRVIEPEAGRLLGIALPEDIGFGHNVLSAPSAVAG